jgi:hypothetical protein
MKTRVSGFYHLHIIRIPAPEARVTGQHTNLYMPIINIHKAHKSYMSIQQYRIGIYRTQRIDVQQSGYTSTDCYIPVQI